MEMVKHTLKKAVKDCKERVQHLKDMGEFEGARNWLKTQRDYEQALNMIERAEENTPTSSEQLAAPDVMHWVSVSERLPKIGTITDVYTTAGHRVTNYTWENHDLQSSFKPHEITHWIAIPEPPCA